MEYRYSASFLKLWHSCKFRVFCKISNQKQDEVDSSYGNAGTVVHQIMEYYYEHLFNINPKLALIELEQQFNRLWEEANILNPKINQNLYWLSVINAVKLNLKATGIEQEYLVTAPFNGIAYVDVENTKEHWLGDWKTATYKASKLEGFKEQLKFYAYVYNQKHNTIPMTWVYFNKVNKIFKYHWTKENLQTFENEILTIDKELQSRISNMDFPRSPSRTNCFFCPYKLLCSSDKLREQKSPIYEIVFNLKKHKLLIEGSIPDIIHRKIEKEINYLLKNAHFMILALQKRGIKYDGIKRLYRRRNYGGETTIGYMHLCNRILKEYAHSQGYKFSLTIKDFRNQEVLKNTISIPKKLNIPFELYDFQKEAVKALIKYRWGICEIGTGGGKTAIAAECIRQLKLRTLFVIDNKDLLMQTKDEYEKMLNIKCGIVGMGKKEWDKPIILATIQTLAKYVKEFANELAQFPLVIYDECLGGTTKISTEDGKKKIQTIVKEEYKGKVLSYNHENECYEWKKILAHYKTEKRRNGYRIYIKNRNKPIRGTAEHKLFTEKGYMKMQDLKVGDFLLQSKQHWSIKSKHKRSGSNNPAYTGIRKGDGRRIFARGKYQYEHQKVFCEYYNIEYIPTEFCIHHLDHNPQNNKIENLLLMTDFAHKSYHKSYPNNDFVLDKEKEKQLDRIKELQKLQPKTIQEKLIPREIIRIEISKAHTGINFYDIEVEDNHNFFANGILSSNCQILAAKSFEILSKYLINSRFRLGFSATPRRDDGNDNLIYANTGQVVYKLNAKNLIAKNVLVNPIAIFYKYKSESVVTDNWQSEYEEGLVNNLKRNHIIIKLANDYAKEGKQVMILSTRIKHCEYLQNIIEDSKLIFGKTDDKIRYDVLEDFKEGKFKILIGNIKIFNKGLNIKNLNVVINAAGNLGEVITIQTIGRALRKSPGKKEALYLDFIDNGNYLHEHSMSRIEALKNEEYTVKILEWKNI